MKRVTFALVGLAVALATAGAEPPPAKPGHLRMAAVNLRCQTADGADPAKNAAAIQANLDRHFAFVDRLSGQGAEFVGFPELSVNGYRFSKTMAWLRLDGPEVAALYKKAKEKGVYLAVGLALEDADGKRYNAHVVIDPHGRIVAIHRKIWLTAEKAFVEAGTRHDVFDVKGLKMGMLICADGTNRANLDALVKNGAQAIYAPHANTTGGTIAGWYRFRAAWGGPEGWVAQLKVHAVLHNHAGLYGTEVAPPPGAPTANAGWASGAWFLSPRGETLAQMPTSTERTASVEHVLWADLPLPK